MSTFFYAQPLRYQVQLYAGKSIRYCLAKKYLKKNLDICGKCITFAVLNQKC